MNFVFGPARLKTVLLTLCGGALFMMMHVFGLPLLPITGRTLPVADMHPEPGVASLAYSIAFPDSADDAVNDLRSRVMLFEDGTPLVPHSEIAGVVAYGRGNYSHREGRLVFSATDNTDPRSNGYTYEAYYPVLYQRAIGYAATLIFAFSLFALYRLPPMRSSFSPPAPAAVYGRNFRCHVIGATAFFLLGLYCSTGTLSPYGNNGYANVLTSYKFIYNIDHVHFRTLFQFVDGQPRAVWENSIFLRRILFPVLAYPFMKIWGFEIGGAIGSLVLNTTALAVSLVLLRRFIGERGTIFAGWLLALYPGAAYWGGLPYVYSIIFPASLLLTIGLLALRTTDSIGRVVWVSLAMGVGYLGYDLIVFFLPVSVFVLILRRRFFFAALAVLLQAAPSAGWLYFLGHGLHQDFNNSNTATFGVLINAYLHPAADFSAWWQLVQPVPAIALTIFFGSGFIFLPALFSLILALNAVTSRIRFNSIETGLLGLGVALFFFNNLAPHYVGPWQMRGTWIARIYQPSFPALVLFCARWFEALPPLQPRVRWTLTAAFAVLGLGNALIIFGPILNNSLAISENAFFAFYDARTPHSLYEDNLRTWGRRPLGFHLEQP